MSDVNIEQYKNWSILQLRNRLKELKTVPLNNSVISEILILLRISEEIIKNYGK